MKYSIVNHQGGCLTLVRLIPSEGEGKRADRRGPIRDRIIIQRLKGGDFNILRGTMMFTKQEIAKLIAI